jgi:hypothetical protein
MESSTVQKYKFREHSDGIMVGGFSMMNILTSADEGSKSLEGFSVPAGLYLSNNNNAMSGGGIMDSKTVLGGTINDDLFDKLYGGLAKCISKRSKKTQKKK